MPLRSLAAALVLFLLTLSVGATQTPSPIRASGIADGDATVILYAIGAGLFRRAGLDVSFQPLSSGSAIAAAVLGGSIDIGKSGTTTLVNAHERNVPITIVAPASIYDEHVPPVSALVVAPDSPIRTAKDLNGQTVAVGSLRGLEQICISGWVDRNGGDSSTLHFLDMPLSAMREAFETHRIVAGMMSYPALADALAAGKVRILGRATEGIGPHYLATAWFTSIPWAQAHPAEVATFARVMREAAAYVNAHPAEMVPMMSQFTSIPAARFAGMPQPQTGLALNAAELQPVIDASAKYHAIAKPFPAAELLFSGATR
jgi:NitT/TauT family transport system substrate-binding protein